MKKTSVLCFFMALGLSVSCSAQWGKRIKGNGNLVSVDRNVGDYDAISVSGWFDVDLVDGREGELTLSGDENLLEHVVTEVSGDQLKIKVKKGINLSPSKSSRGIRITVPVESISGLNLSGSGDIVGKTLIKTPDFKTAMSGSGTSHWKSSRSRYRQPCRAPGI